jgi:hypothetical protein
MISILTLPPAPPYVPYIKNYFRTFFFIFQSLIRKLKRLKWDHTGNIYNHLASQWLIKNLPFDGKACNFDALFSGESK